MNCRNITCALVGFLLTFIHICAYAATPVTYSFSGELNDPFGTLPVGTPFSGSFTYDHPQQDQTPENPDRGDYLYSTITLEIGGESVTDTGTGVINVYDNASYPTDMFHLYTFNIDGEIGGEILAPGAGLQIVLQDVSGTVYDSIDLPGGTFTLSDYTQGNATFIQLQNNDGDQSARGELLSLTPTAGSLTISPPSGDYVTTQGFDLTLIVDAPNLTATVTNVTWNGTDKTAGFNGCDSEGTLIAGGTTFRCPNLSGSFLGNGTHNISATVDLSDGSQVTDSVTWEVKENTEP